MPFEQRPEQRNRVAAIVPAYNEGKRIAGVLAVLTSAPVIDAVIVIDDGSTDDTADVARAVPRVTLLRNSTNRGKADAIQRGIAHTAAGILFLCDADLQGLTAEIVEEIVRPVVEGRYVMFIGVRNNVLQKAVTLFALNSGERALRRDVWDELPSRFKHRFRLEAGLNFVARTRGGYGWRRFAYYQMPKERKYGFLRGTFLRWWMNLDVAYAYLLVLLGRHA